MSNKFLQLNLDWTSFLFSQLILRRDYRESHRFYSYGNLHFITMDPSSGGGSPSRNSSPNTTANAKAKSNSLPTPSSAQMSEETSYAVSDPGDDSSSISSKGPNFLEKHQTQCEGPGIRESVLNGGYSMLEAISGVESEEETEIWADAKSRISSEYGTPNLSPSRIISRTPSTVAVSVKEEPAAATPDSSDDSSDFLQEVIMESDHETAERETSQQRTAESLLVNLTVSSGSVKKKPSDHDLDELMPRLIPSDPVKESSSDQDLNELLPRLIPSDPTKESSSDDSEHDLDELMPRMLRKNLEFPLLMINLGRTESLKELSDDEDTPLSLSNDVQVYRMEKKPERIVTKQEELWFHRPVWTEHPQLVPTIRNKNEEAMEHLKLIVDETNQAEDSNEAELFMMHHRVARSNQAALDTLIQEGDMEVFLTPVGFEDSDVVLERKFFIRWKVAQLYQKSKKEKIKTAIPLTGTVVYMRPIPCRIRVWRRVKHFFEFTWCPCSRNNCVHDEGIIRQDSIEAFHNEIFANAIGLLHLENASITPKRLLVRRENIYGRPISIDNLRLTDNKMKKWSN